MSLEIQPLDYANPQHVKREPSVRFAKIIRLLSIVPGAVGLFLLGAYWLTDSSVFEGGGALWLAIGGSMTVGCAMVVLVLRLFHGFQHPGHRVLRVYSVTLLICLLDVGTAVVCCVVGKYLVERVSVIVTNQTSQFVDRLDIHFLTGDLTLTSLQPGEIRDLGKRSVGHDGGQLEITVTRGGRSETSIEWEFIDDDQMRSGFTATIDDTELPGAPASATTQP